jgi:hypothetical protein
VSNPDGWAAISAASLAINQPHLPNGLAGRLPRAASSLYVVPGFRSSSRAKAYERVA